MNYPESTESEAQKWREKYQTPVSEKKPAAASPGSSRTLTPEPGAVEKDVRSESTVVPEEDASENLGKATDSGDAK